MILAEPLRLLVEGRDDQAVLRTLMQRHQFGPCPQLRQLDGVDRLLEALPVALKSSDLERLGVIVDADTSLNARWQAVRSALLTSGYAQVPTSPDPSGTVLLQEGLPVVGIWLMPDNRVPGMLEDFIRFMVPIEDDMWDIAETAVSAIPSAKRRFPTARRAKAVAHTWLAWQEEPGRPFGTAITAHYLDAEAPIVQALLRWLHRVFAG